MYMNLKEVQRVWTGQKVKQKEKRRKRQEGERVETDGEKSIWQRRGGLKQVLTFPLEEVLMPYWMQLLMNRCGVCGHRDPGSTSCLATHPIEVHRSRAGGSRHQPPPGLRWRDSRTAAPFLGPAGERGWREGVAAQPPQDYSFRV